MPIYEEKKKINGQKRYFIQVYVKDENGKAKRITRRNKEWIGRDGYWLAHQEEAKLKTETLAKKSNVDIITLVEKKIKQDSSYLKKSSVIRYNEFLNQYIKPFFNERYLCDITTKTIIDWHSWLETKNINIESMKKIHNLLKSSLDFGIKYFDLEKNVCEIVGNFKSKRGVVKKQIEFLTYDEFNRFIDFEENEFYKAFFTILFFTGMRRGELLALTFDDIDFKKNIININKSINPKNGKEATVPKTNKSNRQIPLLKNVCDILKSMPYTTKEIFGLDNIKTSTLTRKCNANCKLANINKHIRIHDFRHSFVALCVESGIQIEKISEYVGHENISTTYDVYSHLYPNAKTELVNKLDNFLSKQRQKQHQ